ncbi:ATP-binding protein [Ampullimonas aquatilis]|uniref:PAS domain-containing sensor histidine kinase n=1 Tax=Ampullimonas aquatilis TaxID=1341549 RepID=UPI003C76FA7C
MVKPNGKKSPRSAPAMPANITALEHPTAMEGIDEGTWLDVIQKMDEVYSQLVRDEIALEEKNTELEQTQQFIFSVLSSMSDVLIACNQSGAIEETNAALCELVGTHEDALRGRSIYSLLADEGSVNRMRELLEQSTQPRAGATIEINLQQGKNIVPVDVNCTPRFDQAGRRAGHVFVGRPMGELKLAYQALKQAHMRLQSTQQQLLHSEKMASLGRLVAGVAHELNNPISFVLGNVYALKRYSETLAQYIKLLHTQIPGDANLALRQHLRIDHVLNDLPSLIEGTLEGAHRTTDIVKGLRTFSAIDREERETIDLNEVIERAIHWIIKGAAPSFVVHWQRGEPLPVIGHSGQLLQVLMNVIQNAYDAASNEELGTPTLWINAEQHEGRVRVVFLDNGPGIAVEALKNIFDPFFTTKPVGKGTGLGLSISYGIVEQHGGQLSARNHDKQGAEFILDLPLAKTAKPDNSV